MAFVKKMDVSAINIFQEKIVLLEYVQIIVVTMVFVIKLTMHVNAKQDIKAMIAHNRFV